MQINNKFIKQKAPEKHLRTQLKSQISTETQIWANPFKTTFTQITPWLQPILNRDTLKYLLKSRKTRKFINWGNAPSQFQTMLLIKSFIPI